MQTIETEHDGLRFGYVVVPRATGMRGGFCDMPDEQRGYWDKPTYQREHKRLRGLKRSCERLAAQCATNRARAARLGVNAEQGEKASRLVGSAAALFGRCIAGIERGISQDELRALLTQAADIEHTAQGCNDQFNAEIVRATP